MSHILDIERLSSRIAMERAHGKDIQALRQSLEYVFEMRNYADQLGIIEGMELDTAFQIVEKIKKAIVEDPSTSMTEGNLIKSSSSIKSNLSNSKLIASFNAVA